jgi:hypothetical protein
MREITALTKRLFRAALETSGSELPEGNPGIEEGAKQVFWSILTALKSKGYYVEVSLYPSCEEEECAIELKAGGTHHDGRIWINSLLKSKERSVAIVHEAAHALHEAVGGKGELIPYLAGAVACLKLGVLSFDEAADEVYGGCFEVLRDKLGWIPAKQDALKLIRSWGTTELLNRATQIASKIIRLAESVGAQSVT